MHQRGVAVMDEFVGSGIVPRARRVGVDGMLSVVRVGVDGVSSVATLFSEGQLSPFSVMNSMSSASRGTL